MCGRFTGFNAAAFTPFAAPLFPPLFVEGLHLFQALFLNVLLASMGCYGGYVGFR